MKTFGLPNTQAEYGADVISRIEYCERGGLKELQNKVVEQIRKLTRELAEVKIKGEEFTRQYYMTYYNEKYFTKNLADFVSTAQSMAIEYMQNI